MALSPGTQIGPYQIVDQIGSGGMGEVYRATDTKLGRDIAIKTLPSALAQEPDRLARFEREARLLATLNHAHIGAIYGLDEHEGAQFIAMELVEGRTLEEKLKDGPLPIEDALQIGLQIAEALEAAHDKGIVHRDLKPANIMLTPDGVVKVLDFGLAKAFAGVPSEASPAHSPALSLAMTQQGLILGTAGYMSPEQASGQATDQRADIWAFGVLLYEMLAGLPPFSGESVPHILADVLRTEPDWKRLPKQLHPRLRLLLERCLEKKVRNRYHSVADVRVDIEKVLGDPLGVTQAASTIAQPTQPAWRRVLPTTALVIVAAVITAVAVWVGTRPGPRPVNRFDHDIPAGQTFRFPAFNVLAFSRDGRSIVYNTTDGLYLRSMDAREARLIPGTEDPLADPEFSPDGQSIIFITPGDVLKRMPISGGAPVELTRITPGSSLSYDSADWILYAQPDGVYRISANGGPSELIVPSTQGEGIRNPRLLPDGDSVLFSTTSIGSAEDEQVVAQSIATGERTVLISSGSDARYLPSGHLVYALQDGLYAVAFDLETLTALGVPVQLGQGLRRSPGTRSANYGVSDDGTLVYMTGGSAADVRTLLWVDREGNEEPIAAPPRAYQSPRLSPDGTVVALTVQGQDLDIWTWDLIRETSTRLTFDPGADRFPVWSPDGRRIAYSAEAATDDPNTILVWKAADGSGTAEQLAGSSRQIFSTSFLPDATGILVFGELPSSSFNDDIAVVPRNGSGQITTLLDSPAFEAMPEISPDGRWLAYVSNESGNDEIYVRPFPDVGAGLWQISTDGGSEPLWARNGEELFFRRDGAVVAVRIQTDPVFSVGNPEVILEGPYLQGILGGRSYDINADGDKFLMLATITDESAAPQIVIVQNWVEELKRIVPTERL